MNKIYVMLFWPLVILAISLSAQEQTSPLPSPEARAQEILDELMKSGSPSSVAETVQTLLERLASEFGAEHPIIVDTLFAAAKIAFERGHYSRAASQFQQLVELSTRISGRHSIETLRYLDWLAGALGASGDLNRELRLRDEVLAEKTRILGPEHLKTLISKANLAETLFELGDLKGARMRGEEALEALTRIHGPEHPDTLRTQLNLAGTLEVLGDLVGARLKNEKVLEVRLRILGAEHPDTLKAKSRLASTLFKSGDLTGAEALCNEVLEVRTRILGHLHPDTLAAKTNLAGVLFALADFKGARLLQEEALASFSRILGRENLNTLTTEEHLAGTLQALGDLKSARLHEENVLAVRTRILGPEHPETIGAMSNLADTLFSLSDLEGARKLFENVLAAQLRVFGAEHPNTITTQANLAATFSSLGDLEEARRRGEAVLTARSRLLGLAHPDTWQAMHNLAVTLYFQNDFIGTRKLLERTVELRRTNLGKDHRPNSKEEANNLFFLGLAQRATGELDKAFASLLDGLAVLEAQFLQTDFSAELKTRFRIRYDVAYQEAVTTGLAAGKVEAAFQVLERYRTQSLLASLRLGSNRDGGRTPEGQRLELATIAHRYDQLTRQLDQGEHANSQVLLHEQGELRRRREVIQGQIVEAQSIKMPGLRPLQIEEIRQTLDAGTLLLAYSIGSDGGHLFALSSKGPLTAYPIVATEAELISQVAALRTIDDSQMSAVARINLSSWLYEKLLSPAETRIAEAERLVILPDGPLNSLPFSALTLPTAKDTRGWQFLIEAKPVHIVQSATVYTELQARRGYSAATSFRWVGFGNPAYPGEVKGPSGAIVRSAIKRGHWDGGLKPLIFSEQEVRAIALLFPPEKAQFFLNEHANEDRAREIAGSSRIVHFASHGVADSDYPQDSFLALSLVENQEGLKENGLLQAWEIADHLELDADLVVLSACETGAGPDRGGEGLISLSRAFQIAGARSVLASLWAVNDQSTSELMIRFYRHMLSGKSKDQALQAAQIELIRGPIEVTNEKGEKEMRDFRAPYHWAAFQLIGDWQ